MNKSLITTACLLVASMSSLKATTVTFGVVPTSRTLNSSTGVQLTTSSSFWIGTFASEASIASVVDNALSVATNVAAITTAGGWEQFTMDTVTGTLNSGAVSTLDITGTGQLGRLGGSATDNNTGATKADFFGGKQLYVWAFNANTIGAATEMGIFEATTATVPWIFPTNAGGLGDTLLLSTSASGATIAAVGGVGSISGSQLRTEAFGVIPEPSRIMLLAFGMIGLIGRRRR
jgi:hypothetical protein